ADTLALLSFPQLLIAALLIGQRLLLALQCFALLFAPRHFFAPRRLFAPRHLFAPDPLFTQDLRIVIGGAARLLHLLRMGLAAQLFIAQGLAALLLRPARLRFAPRLLGPQRQLLALGLLVAPGLLPGLLGAAGRLFPLGLLLAASQLRALGLVGANSDLLAFGLLGAGGDLFALGLFCARGNLRSFGLLGLRRDLGSFGLLSLRCDLLTLGLLGASGPALAHGLSGLCGQQLALGLPGTLGQLLAPGLLLASRLAGLCHGGGRRRGSYLWGRLRCFLGFGWRGDLGLLFGGLRLLALSLFLLGGLAGAQRVGFLLSLGELNLGRLGWRSLGRHRLRWRHCRRRVGDHLANFGTGRRHHVRGRGARAGEHAAALGHRRWRHHLRFGQRVGRHAHEAGAHRPAALKVFSRNGRERFRMTLVRITRVVPHRDVAVDIADVDRAGAITGLPRLAGREREPGHAGSAGAQRDILVA